MTVVTYMGINRAVSPAMTISGDPLTQHNAFTAVVTIIATETFESFAQGNQAPLTILGTGSLALVAAPNAGLGHRISGLTSTGRFNTTGVSGAPIAGLWWETTQSYTVVFPSSRAAFGLYMTDSADFKGTMSITPKIAGVDQTTIDLASIIGGSANGALAFFGVTNDAALYSGFTVVIAQPAVPVGQYDVTGFDDIIIGDLIAPPPAAVPLYVSVGRARRG